MIPNVKNKDKKDPWGLSMLTLPRMLMSMVTNDPSEPRTKTYLAILIALLRTRLLFFARRISIEFDRASFVSAVCGGSSVAILGSAQAILTSCRDWMGKILGRVWLFSRRKASSIWRWAVQLTISASFSALWTMNLLKITPDDKFKIHNQIPVIKSAISKSNNMLKAKKLTSWIQVLTNIIMLRLNLNYDLFFLSLTWLLWLPGGQL